MTSKEELKRTRRINRIRRILHEAESKVWFDSPEDERSQQIGAALNILDAKLPPKLKRRVLDKNHITRLTNFWVIVSNQHQMKGLVNTDKLLTVFHQIIAYCDRESARRKGSEAQAVATNPAINPIE